MKRSYFKIFIIFAVVVLAAATLVACNGDKGASFVSIRFETNGGNAIQTLKEEAGKPIVPPHDPVKEGFTFAGWHLAADLSDEPVELPTAMPSKDATYYAAWIAGDARATYTVYIHLQNGDGDDYAVDDGRTTSGTLARGSQVSVAPPSIEHYVFVPERSSALEFTLDGDRAVHLYYKGANARVRYFVGGEEFAVEDAYYGENHAALSADVPSDEGTAFVGWAEEEGETLYLPGEKAPVTSENVELHAQFGTLFAHAFDESKSLAISSFEKDGGFIAMYDDGESVVYGVAEGAAEGDRITAGDRAWLFDAYGKFREDESGTYACYDLAKNAVISASALTLNSSDMTATLEENGRVSEGTYSYITRTVDDETSLTNEIMFDPRSGKGITLRLVEREDSPEGFDGCYQKKGDEAGDYYVISDIADGMTERLYMVRLDGYGELSFPIMILQDFAIGYGNYCGYDIEKGVWQYRFDHLLESIESDTLYASGHYDDCLFVLASATQVVENGGGKLTMGSADNVFIRVIEGTEGAYTADEGTLILNGFGLASFTPAGEDAIDGYYEKKGNIIEFSHREGGVLVYNSFILDGESFVQVDGTAGEYKNGAFTLTLNGLKEGKGDAFVYTADRLIAEGEYTYADGEGEFSATWLDFLYPMINGIAVGKFGFKLDGDAFILRNDVIFGEYELDGGGTITFDGYGMASVNGDEYEVGERIINTVMLGENGYILDIDARTARLATKLVGSYMTVVDEYVGPGKLSFDGNGGALFFNMTKGEQAAQGSYTYDEESNRGKFIPEATSAFPVEPFEFLLTEADDQYGEHYDKVYFKYHEDGHIERDFGDFSIALSGFGWFTDNNSDVQEDRFELTFHGVGASYTYPQYDISVSDADYTIAFECTGELVGNNRQYRYTGNMTIVIGSGNMNRIVVDKDGNATVYGNEYGRYTGYNAQHNAYGSEKLVLDGEGGAKAWDSYSENEPEENNGTYSVIGDEFEFIPNEPKTPSEDEIDRFYYHTFRCIVFTGEDSAGNVYDFFYIGDDSVVLDLTLEGGDDRIEVDRYRNVTYTDGEGTVHEIPFNRVSLDIAYHVVLFYLEDDEPVQAGIFEETNTFKYMGLEADSYQLWVGNTYTNEIELTLDGYGNFEIERATGTLWGIPIDFEVFARGTYVESEIGYKLTVTETVDEYYTGDVKTLFPKTPFDIMLAYTLNEAGTRYVYVFAVYDSARETSYSDGAITVKVDTFGRAQIYGLEGVEDGTYVNFATQTTTLGVFATLYVSELGKYYHYFLSGSTLTPADIDFEYRVLR